MVKKYEQVLILNKDGKPIGAGTVYDTGNALYVVRRKEKKFEYYLGTWVPSGLHNEGA